MTVTCAPVIVVLSFPSLPNVGLQDGARQEVPSVKLVPKMATIVPGATALEPAPKVAPFTVPPGLSTGNKPMAKAKTLEVPPPGAGLNTATWAVPPDAMSLAGIAAVNRVALTKLVVRAVPFHWTKELRTKFVPVTVKVKAAPPGVVREGERELSPGVGLLVGKVNALEVPPPGVALNTVTCAVPADATSVAEMDAVNCVLLTKAEGLLLPFHWTTDPVTKLVPMMVNLKADEPAVTLLGESVLNEGAGLLMVKVNALEAPPPGIGLNTVT